MVGRRTALLDNPSLTVRNWYGHNPIRVVLDRTLSLPNDLQIFDGNVPTLVLLKRNSQQEPTSHISPSTSIITHWSRLWKYCINGKYNPYW